MLTSANSYQIMQLLNVLSMLLPLLLPVKQEFPIGGIIVSICQTFGLTLRKCLLSNVQQILSHNSMISTNKSMCK